ESSRSRRRVVTLSSANVQTLGIWARDLDVDFAPRSVGPLIGGQVANRVLRPDLAKHLLVNSIEILDAAREEGRPSGCFRNIREQRSLNELRPLRLILERSDRVHGGI